MARIFTLAHQRPARMSKKFREVLRLHEIEGMSVTDACAKVGYSRAGYYKAGKNPAVKEMIREMRLEVIERMEAKKAFAKLRAIEVGIELMETSTSETIRMRAVEFFGADAKVSPVSVHIENRPAAPPGGYIYTRPAHMIEGTPGDEAAS